MRELSDFSIENIADELNISVEKYAEYENGDTDIPASILYEISQLLKIDMPLLLTGQEPKMHVFTVCRKDKGPSVERRTLYKYQNLAANFIGAKGEPFLVTVDPKPEGEKPSTNSHPGQEFDYVLEGTLKILIHNNELTLKAGDSIYFDSKYEHAMQAVGDRPAKFLAVII
jgi:mannose-6-phosphate isomerase-like protein (cupin superfamily)